MRRFAIAALLLAPLACGLTYSPGDFLEPAASTATRSDGGTLVTEAGSVADAASTPDAGPQDVRVVLFAGHRDSVEGEAVGTVDVAETILGAIHPDGTLAPWTFDAPPPIPAQWTHATIAGGSVYVHNRSTLVHASFTDRVSGAWTVAAIPGPPQPGVRPWALDERGVVSDRSTSGDNRTWFAPFFPDGGVGPWAQPSAVTAVVRGDATLVRAGDFVYAIGGQISGGLGPLNTTTYTANVEVSKRTASGDVGDFVVTSSLAAIDGGLYSVFAPVAVAGSDHIFILGGLTTTAPASRSSVAMAARINDPSSGVLDPWVVLPPLPTPMTAFAALATQEWLVVFGGENSAGKAVDGVLRLARHPDGTYGSAWETAGKLPAPRSNIVAVGF